MPEPQVDTPTAVASTYGDTVRLGIEAPSVRPAVVLVNPHSSADRGAIGVPGVQALTRTSLH